MNIKITSGEYKSIKQFEWLNIPPLSVITGINGTGKTQLLELINYYYHRELYDKQVNKDRGNTFPQMTIENFNINKEDVVFLTSEFGLKNVGVVDLAEHRNLLKIIYDHGTGKSRQPRQQNKDFDEIISKVEFILQKKITQVTEDEFVKNIPFDFIITKYIKFNEKIAQLFYSYFIRTANEKLNGKEELEIRRLLGPPPWEVLEAVIERTNLPYRLTNPEGLDLMAPFELKLYDKTKKEIQIDFNDLSGGEKVIMSLVFWLYNSQEHNLLPKLILLDEPDAHLHPSMAIMFIEVVNDILVNKYGARVIMTTHSPTTAVLVQHGSLFEMKKENPRITLSTDISKTISLLTSNLITVNKTTKFVLVEDEDDVIFHSKTLEILKSEGFLNDNISIVFISASSKQNQQKASEKISGGKNVVSSWVKKLKDSGLQDILNGIIDRDINNIASDGIYIIDRYSIENYLLDPIIIYGALMEFEIAPKIKNLDLKFGEQWKIKNLNPDIIQDIADKIIEIIEKDNRSFSSELKKRQEVTFTNEIKIKYPKWLLDFKGHELMNIIRIKLPEKNVISFENLIRSMRKIQMVSNEYIKLYQTIWNN